MESPPYHYYNHNLHNHTVINVHTLLKPQAYQQPDSITHTSQAHTNPDFTNHSLPLNLPHNTLSILQQILHSQQISLQTMSNCAKTFSTITADLKTLNTNLSPLVITHNTTHNLQQYSSQLPQYSTHNHVNTKPPLDLVWVSHKPSTHQQKTNMFNGTNCPCQTPNSPPEVPPPFFVQPLPPSDHSEEETLKTHLLVVDVVDSVDLFLTIDSISQVGWEENKLLEPLKLVPTLVTNSDLVSKVVGEQKDLVTIPDTVSDSVEKQKRHVINDLEKSISATTTPSTELKVVRIVAITVTPEQHPHITFELPVISIHIFDPGGTLAMAVNPAARHRQVQTFKCCDLFSLMTVPSPSCLALSLTLLWDPWDRGKNIWQLLNKVSCIGGDIIPSCCVNHKSWGVAKTRSGLAVWA